MTKILIVDDEPLIAELLQDRLEAEGFEVVTQHNGLDALQTMLTLRPDLVISDLMMPSMGGVPMLTAMQENAYLADTPVILMSGRPEDDVPKDCRNYKAFLRKPMKLDDVVATVQRVTAGEDGRV
ncbi:nitrogen regulation protein NR(I) [Bordetella ansorpii]|uniref:Nitrogen regulation protein NR(I) n=1 Tax=Bordetella ansorpii TaxID=288768 RepID=A0A157REM2_9BORD|nr:response regulator [Bordetella ansorpii]SAI56413.1 nitrogen regulation protein NR(I) [Bordetella ansorpii]